MPYWRSLLRASCHGLGVGKSQMVDCPTPRPSATARATRGIRTEDDGPRRHVIFQRSLRLLSRSEASISIPGRHGWTLPGACGADIRTLALLAWSIRLSARHSCAPGGALSWALRVKTLCALSAPVIGHQALSPGSGWPVTASPAPYRPHFKRPP